MYSLHLTHPRWTHTRSSGQPCYSARGAVGGSVPCSKTPQSWYWRRILQSPPTIPAGPEIRTHNLPLTIACGFCCKQSDSLSIRPRLPLVGLIHIFYSAESCWLLFKLRELFEFCFCETEETSQCNYVDIYCGHCLRRCKLYCVIKYALKSKIETKIYFYL